MFYKLFLTEFSLQMEGTFKASRLLYMKVFVSAPTAKQARKHSLKEAKKDNRPSAKKH